MTTTYSPNKGYALPGTGDDPNLWGPVVNGNFAVIDANISAAAFITTTGGQTVLSATQAQNLLFNFNGALTSFAQIVFPFVRTFFLATNGTTGNYNLSLVGAGNGTAATLPAGQSGVFYCDGTNVVQMGGNAIPIPSGTIMGSFLQASAPSGWTQSTAFNDQVIRLVSSTGGATGGSWTISGATVAGTSITTAQLPTFNLTYVAPSVGSGNYISGTSSVSITGNLTQNTSSIGSNAAHGHGWSNDGTWRPAYVNAIVAVKN